jgi:hypothetical protein
MAAASELRLTRPDAPIPMERDEAYVKRPRRRPKTMPDQVESTAQTL